MNDHTELEHLTKRFPALYVHFFKTEPTIYPLGLLFSSIINDSQQVFTLVYTG